MGKTKLNLEYGHYKIGEGVVNSILRVNRIIKNGSLVCVQYDQMSDFQDK